MLPYMVPNSSFNEPVELPAFGPDVGPFVCAPISVYWLPYVLGALSQLAMPVAWKWTTEAQLDTLMHQVDALIGSVATAHMCSELGHVTATILAGNSSASVAVTFPTVFTAVPEVIVSSNNPDLIASWDTATTTGVNVVVTASVPVLVNTSATVTWLAGPTT